MKSTIGRPRALTDLQVAAILAWHAQILEWKAKRCSPIRFSGEGCLNLPAHLTTCEIVAGETPSSSAS